MISSYSVNIAFSLANVIKHDGLHYIVFVLLCKGRDNDKDHYHDYHWKGWSKNKEKIFPLLRM